MNRFVWRGTLLAGVLIVSSGFMNFSSDKVLVKVGKEKVTESQVTALINQFPEGARAQFETPEGRQKIIDQLVNEALLINQAKVLELDEQDDYVNQINTSKKQLLLNMLISQEINTTVSDDEVKAFYDENPTEFNASQQRRASHILLKTKAEATQVSKKLAAGKSFDTLAQQFSTDSSKVNGGDIGWFRKGQVPQKEFEKALFGIPKVGLTSAIFKTEFGYHLVKLTGLTDSPKVTFEQAKSQIVNMLKNQKQQAALMAYIENLKKTVKIKQQ